MIDVKFHRKSQRISLTDRRPVHIGEPAQRKYFPIDYNYNSFLEQGEDILTKNGWSIVGQAEMTLLSDSWYRPCANQPYPEIKNLKK